jgi:hypothetical protein
MTVVEFLGVDTSLGALAALIQCVTAVNTTGTGSVSLSAFRSPDNRPVGVFSHTASEANTVDASPAGYTMINDENYATPARSMGTEWNPSATDTTVTMTWTTNTVAWLGIAAEIAAFQSGPKPIKGTKQAVNRASIF